MFGTMNQVAIVTGGTRGIGKGITQELLIAGATVIATYANNDEAANAFRSSEMTQYSDKLHLENLMYLNSMNVKDLDR